MRHRWRVIVRELGLGLAPALIGAAAGWWARAPSIVAAQAQAVAAAESTHVAAVDARWAWWLAHPEIRAARLPDGRALFFTYCLPPQDSLP